MGLIQRGSFAWARGWESVKFPLIVFLIVRVSLSVVAAVSIATSPTVPIAAGNFVFQSPMDQGIGHYLLEPWNRWDTQWYLKIALQGYDQYDGGLAFFPLYPLLIRMVGEVIGRQWFLAALLISNGCALASMILLYHIVAHQFGDLAARRTIILFLAFPTAFYLFAAYTESLFLMFTLLALTNAQNQRWKLASVAVALASLTRLQGVVLILPVLIEVVTHYRSVRLSIFDWASILFSGSSIGIYWFYIWLVYGDVGVWMRSMALWRVPGIPGQAIIVAIQQLWLSSGRFWISNLLDLIATCFFIVLVIWAARRLSWSLNVYSIVMLIIPLMSIQTLVSEEPLTLMPRYGLILFPIFIALSLPEWQPRSRSLLIVGWIGLQLILVALFVNGFWVA